jgi:hypothetical protein
MQDDIENWVQPARERSIDDLVPSAPGKSLKFLPYLGRPFLTNSGGKNNDPAAE